MFQPQSNTCSKSLGYPGAAIPAGTEAGEKEKPEWANQLEGCNFINDFGPKAINQNQFMIFADQYCNDSKFKMFGWPEAKVNEALPNYSEGKQSCKTIKNRALTIRNGLNL